jgi:hypothetical protein
MPAYLTINIHNASQCGHVISLYQCQRALYAGASHIILFMNKIDVVWTFGSTKSKCSISETRPGRPLVPTEESMRSNVGSDVIAGNK